MKVKTLQKWDREGILVAYRTPTNRRYYTHTQYLQYLGQEDNAQKDNVIYTRVNGNGEKDDLKRQADFLVEWCHHSGISIANIYSDIGSGINFNRKDWNRLIDDCIEGRIANIYVAYKDRFIRFGFDWFQRFLLSKFGVNLIAVNDVVSSPQEDLIEDLISIIQVFSCRIPGLRRYQKKIEKEFDDVHDETDNIQLGN